MTSALLRRVRRLEQRILPPPRTWLFVLEDGDELSDEQRAQVKPGDTVIVEQYPRFYFEGGRA